jgi:hypothetical protein
VYGQGLDIKGDLLKHAIEHGIVSKSGAWYYYNKDMPDMIRAQGAENAKETFPFDILLERLHNV